VLINSIEAGRVFANLATADYTAVGADLGAAIAMLAGLVFGLLCHHYIERPLLAAGTKRSRTVPAT